MKIMRTVIAWCIFIAIFSFPGLVSPAQAELQKIVTIPPDAAPNSPSERVGPEFQISPSDGNSGSDSLRFNPEIAFNFDRGQYLVVWENHWPYRDVYAQRIDGNGNKIDSFQIITFGSGNRYQPALAYDDWNDEFLVVWTYDVLGDGSRLEVWGRRVGWDLSWMGPPTRLAADDGRHDVQPRLAWNSYEHLFLLVWTSVEASSGLSLEIGGRFLWAGDNGSILMDEPRSFATDEEPDPFTVKNDPWNPDLAYDLSSNKYLLVYDRLIEIIEPDQTEVYHKIYKLLINHDGTIDFSEMDVPSWFMEQEGHPSVINDDAGHFYVAFSSQTADEYILPTYPYKYLICVCRSTVGEGNPTTSCKGENQDVDFVDIAHLPGSLEQRVFYQLMGETYTSIKVMHFRPHQGSWGGIPMPYSTSTIAQWDNWDCNRPGIVYGGGSNYMLVAYECEHRAMPWLDRHIYGRIFYPWDVWIPLVFR